MEIQETSRLTRLATQLVAAKQDLVNMGYPEIVSKLLYEKYGKLAPLIAKWYKGYKASGAYAESPDWWRRVNWSARDDMSLSGMTHLYEEGLDPESFKRVAEFEGIYLRYDIYTQEQVDEWRQRLVNMIRDKFFDETFFTYYPIMQDISSGKFKDVAPYKKLSFTEAAYKYDERRHFEQTTPLKVYPNKFKWIDTGKKSVVLSEQMKNCGSAGVMSMDEDRTILALFGPTNKPHVMVTYSPNEKRISGDECAGSSPVKPEYHDYVIDLANELGARFDTSRSKSKSLRVKYMLKNKAQSIEQLEFEDRASYSYDVYFKFISDGKEYYTNGETVVSGSDVDRIQDEVDNGELDLPYPQDKSYKNALGTQNNINFLAEYEGVKYIPLNRFVET